MSGVISCRNYYPGDLIYREEPFAKVVLGKHKDDMCEWCCQRSFGFLKSCQECKAVKYCGKACQRNDWPTHRLECKHLKHLAKNDLSDFTRFLGKVLLKTKDCDWKLIKERILGKDVTFDDVDSHFEEFCGNPKLMLFFKEIKESLISYIGVKNLPDDDRLLKVLGKVKWNSFKEPLFFFGLGVTQFDEECIPNTCVCIGRNEVRVWACKTIRKGIDKISMPKRRILSNLELIDGEKKPCKCTDCSLPYGESILTKVINERRAYSVIEESEAVLLASSVMPKYAWNPQVVEKLLEKQREVLGHTNHLHLKLLALKCLEIGGDPLAVEESLLELETNMKSVFGEYYCEMERIYEFLGIVNVHLGNPYAAVEYMKKANRIMEFRFDP